MIYCDENLGIDLAQLQQMRKTETEKSVFTWDIRYLPVVIGFVGVLAAGIYLKRKKKRGKK